MLGLNSRINSPGLGSPGLPSARPDERNHLGWFNGPLIINRSTTVLSSDQNRRVEVPPVSQLILLATRPGSHVSQSLPGPSVPIVGTESQLVLSASLMAG